MEWSPWLTDRFGTITHKQFEIITQFKIDQDETAGVRNSATTAPAIKDKSSSQFSHLPGNFQ